MRRTLSKRQLPDTALKYVLESLVPFTDANIKLAFKPNLFFNDLENIDKQKDYHKTTLRSAYYKAQQKGLIKLDASKVPRLTEKGHRMLQPYKPKKLKDACLMVIFDIPETMRAKRSHLRLLLKELKFRQIQKSVWVSQYDHREYLTTDIKEQELEGYVIIYEARVIK